MADQLQKTPFNAESIKKRNTGFLGIDRALAIKAFFGGNALVSIIVLALITFFLFREGVEFFPDYRKDLELYRASGQELVGILKAEVDEFDELQKDLNDVQKNVMVQLYDQGLDFKEVNEATASLRDFVNQARQSASPLKKVTKVAIDKTVDAKEIYITHETRRTVEDADLSKLMTPEEGDALLRDTRQAVLDLLPEMKEANDAFRMQLNGVLQAPPQLENPEHQAALEEYIGEAEAFLDRMQRYEKKVSNYDPDADVSIFTSLKGFLFGTEWITNSSWQDFYGVWPLLSGSLLVTMIALTFAIPLGICSAIYVNQVASAAEQNLIKPYIEFISAIPSVVIGFFGIAVFGESIRVLSEQAWMAWVPFFPIAERLNAFTAGGLLALMAVPTIFTLAEDAINNVPKAFSEASIAMGATRWQTIWRIMLPSSISGIISAILLGFGRVIGETMVVLLCAGNRISIPDFTKGPGVAFEPVHTMTGIVAQEMGEVVPGSIHYRALFVVGILLFFFSLAINYTAQRLVRKYKVFAG